MDSNVRHGHGYRYHPDVVPYTRTTAFLFAPGTPTSAAPTPDYPAMDWRVLRGTAQEARRSVRGSAAPGPVLRSAAPVMSGGRDGRDVAPVAAQRVKPERSTKAGPPAHISAASSMTLRPPPLVAQHHHSVASRFGENADSRERVREPVAQHRMHAPEMYTGKHAARPMNGAPAEHRSHAHGATDGARARQLERRETSRYSDLDAVWSAGASEPSFISTLQPSGQRQPFSVSAAVAMATGRLHARPINNEQAGVVRTSWTGGRGDGVGRQGGATQETPNGSAPRAPQALPESRINVRPAREFETSARPHDLPSGAPYGVLASAEQATAYSVHANHGTAPLVPTQACIVEVAFVPATSFADARAPSVAATSPPPRQSPWLPSTPVQRRVWADTVHSSYDSPAAAVLSRGSSPRSCSQIEASVRRRLEALAAALTDGEFTGASEAAAAPLTAVVHDARGATAEGEEGEEAVAPVSGVSSTSVLSPLSPQNSRPSPLSVSASVSAPSPSSHATSPSAVRARLTYGSAQDAKEAEEEEEEAAGSPALRRRRHSSPRGSVSPLSRLSVSDSQLPLPLPLPARQSRCGVGLDLEGQRCALLQREEAAEREWLAVDATVRLHRLACQERAAFEALESPHRAPSCPAARGGAAVPERGATGLAASEAHDSPSTTPAERRLRRMPSASSLPPLSPRTPVLSRPVSDSDSDFSDVCRDEGSSQASEEVEEASLVDMEDTTELARDEERVKESPTKAETAAAAADAMSDGTAGAGSAQRDSGKTLPPLTSPSHSPHRRLRTLLEEEEDLRFLITGACPPPEVFQRWADRYLEGQQAAAADAAGAPSTEASQASVHTSYTAEEGEAAAGTAAKLSPVTPFATSSPPVSPLAAAPGGRRTMDGPHGHCSGSGSAPRTASSSRSPAPRPVSAGDAREAVQAEEAAAAAEAPLWRDSELSPSTARQQRYSERNRAWATDDAFEELGPDGDGYARRSGTATASPGRASAGEGRGGRAAGEFNATGRYAPLPHVFAGVPTPPSSPSASPATSSPSAASRPTGGEGAATSETSSQPRHSSQVAGSSSFSLHVVAPPTEETYLPPVGSERDAWQALMDLFIEGLLQLVDHE